MGLIAGLALIVVGAILIWGVAASASVGGIGANTLGVILMLVGGLGALLALVVWSSRGGFGTRAVEDERTIPRR